MASQIHLVSPAEPTRPDLAETQVEQGWGQGPSQRYEALAAPFRPVFRRIRTDAVVRDAERRLPFAELGWLKEAAFTTLRVPAELGGQGVTLPELFALLVELSAADPNITNILRPHIGFTEDLLNSGNEGFRDRWLDRIAAGDTFGNGFSETGGNVGVIATRLVRDGDDYRLDGRKYYTTGTLFADWINLGAIDENGAPTGGLIPRHAPGVEVLDDWNGFGQILTGSGTPCSIRSPSPPTWSIPSVVARAMSAPSSSWCTSRRWPGSAGGRRTTSRGWSPGGRGPMPTATPTGPGTMPRFSPWSAGFAAPPTPPARSSRRWPKLWSASTRPTAPAMPPGKSTPARSPTSRRTKRSRSSAT
jgi:hypothetical protein